MYTFSCGYNWHYNNPFSTYGENVFLVVQSLAIMVLFLVYDKSVSVFSFVSKMVVYGGIFFLLYTDRLSDQVFQFTILINMALRKLSYVMIYIKFLLFV